MTDDEVLQLCDRALDTPYGIEIITDNPAALRRRFYALRARLREFKVTKLNLLSCRIMGDDTIHLVNQGGDNGKKRPREGNDKTNSRSKG